MPNVTVNTFRGGLNSDTSKNKYSPENYVFAENLQIITSDNLSTGAVVNTRGTRSEFTIPDVPETEYEEGSENGAITIPALSDLQIIGGTSYDNFVLVFTCNNAGYGQVWRVEYNEVTGLPIGLSSGSLVVATHLIYSRYLNWSNTHRVKAWVRKESSVFIRLYMNDLGRNPMRSLNIVGTPATIQLTRARTIDLQPLVNFELPLLKEILTGNLPNGRIGYFYRLISKDGSSTCYSSISNLIDLNNGNENGLYQFYPDSAIEFKSDEASKDAEKRRLDFSSEKALRMFIPKVDKDYYYIQVGYVLYQIPDVPLIYLLPLDTLQDNGSDKEYMFVHSGLEKDVVAITPEEFNALNNTFVSFKDFTPKDNDLYVANIRNEQFIVDFDARAYRFDSTQIANIYNEAGALEFSIDGSVPLVFPNNITEKTFDAINPYNDENPDTNPDWDTADQYKYQSDGTTLGGEGPNVSYTFITHDHIIDNDVPLTSLVTGDSISDIQNSAPFTVVKKELTDSVNFGLTNQTYTGLSKSFSDLKSPYKSSLYEGHARGEVYRCGLTFVKTNGQRSFTIWIGDIKFPMFTDSGYELDYFDTVTGTYYIRTLGIEFTIDNIPQDIIDEIESIEIVRVPREDKDRTRLGTGITGGFLKNESSFITLDDIRDIINSIVETLIGKVIGKATGIFSWIPGTDTIQKQIAESMADAITNGFPVGSTAIYENFEESDLRNLITGSIGQVGGKTAFGLTGLLLGRFGEQLADWVIDQLLDYIKSKKVGGIDNVVYSLDNAEIVSGASTGNEGTIANKNYGYVISPIVQFDKYKFRTDDYLVPVASYEYDPVNLLYPKLTQVYHRDTNVSIFNRVHSTAKYRKWLKPVYFTDINRLTIELENTLDVGEILVPNEIARLPSGTFVNAFLGRVERLQDDGDYIASIEKLSVRTIVSGIGDKKHFVKLEDSFPDLFEPSLGIYKVYDQQGDNSDNRDSDNNWISLLYSDNNYYNNYGYPSFPQPITDTTGDTLTLTRPDIVDSSGNFLVSYQRYVIDQYGGNSYSDRALNKYIPIAVIPIEDLAADAPITLTCYRGDTYVGMYDSVNYAYYMEQVPGYNKANKTKKALGELFPAEAPFNFNVREGQHFNNAASDDDLDNTEQRVKRKLRKAKRQARRSGLDFQQVAEIILPKRFLYDEHIYDDVYDQQNILQVSFPEPLVNIFTDTNTNRIFKSNPKIDGELLDQWKIFKPLAHKDVEGIYGEITSIHANRGRLYFYQENAFGIITTNERNAVATDKGSLVVANSINLSRYDYISMETGCSHTFGVVNTSGALYHFDINNKKLFEFGDQLTPISDTKGLSGFFKTNLLNGDINTTDQTLADIPIGIHGIYDSNNNRVYFTFLNQNTDEEQVAFTVNYNLLAKCFESFHSFTPGLYLKTINKLFSPDPLNRDKFYQHNIGNYNLYYGVLYPTTITILNNNNPASIKTFDNHLIFTEVTDSNGINLVGETINAIQCSNDSQDSGNVILTVGTNIVRKDRKWHLQIPRDLTPSAYTTLQARLSDTYLLSKLTYNNTLNRRLVLHDIYTDYRESIT